jgi:hypothetical protein
MGLPRRCAVALRLLATLAVVTGSIAGVVIERTTSRAYAQGSW